MVALGLMSANNRVTGQVPDDLNSVKSSPPYISDDWRPLTSSESGAQAQGANPDNLPPSILIRDVVINNTNANLTNTDLAGDTETSIAINPANPNEIVILAFSGGWGANAPQWHSTDGGLTWTKQFTIPRPPPGTAGGPNDQAPDFGRGNRLSATFLINNVDVVTGTTTNPALSAAWNWFLVGPNTQLTNAAAGVGNSDQPWLLVNRDTTTAANDNVYVAYDDFGGGPDMRVAVSYNANPPNFTVNVQSGTSTNNINPGHRLAKDTRTGFMYSLWQRCVANCGSDVFRTIEYRLNRSTDAGATWPQNGGAGVVVATANSTQPRAKFGTVNALLGGVLHAAVDATTGDVYYVYGNRDGGTGVNRLSLQRLQDNGAGVLVNVGPASFVTDNIHQAAIPSVAVASDGTVGVFYYTFDGFSSDSFPIFSAHVAFSRDQGATFKDSNIYTFLSVVKDDGVAGSRQRVLGDYQQMKTVGRTFYGSFTGNGAGLGRPIANTDPIFFRATVGPVINTSTTTNFGDVCKGDTKSTKLEIFNTGIDDLTITSVARVSGSADIAVGNGPIVPTVVSPDAHVDFDITCSPTTFGTKTAVIRILSNDPDRPQVDVTYTCNTPAPAVGVTGSTDFGNVCGGTQSEKVISVCNFGKCNLNVVSVTSSCPDFTIINNPFPRPVSEDFCVPVTVRFTPTSPGPKTCQLTIITDDPNTPIIVKTLTGGTPAASIDVPFPGGLSFPADVVQSTGACKVSSPFPISNTGICPLVINSITVGGVNASDFSLSGLPSSPIILEQGHIAGEGDLKAVFAATEIDRDRLGNISVTYVSNPVTGGTSTITRDMCGEGVNTGARVLVVNGSGTPYANVESIQLQRINANRNKNAVDTIDNSRDLAPVTVTPSAPCATFTYHKEYGTVSNPIMLLPGSYDVTATVLSASTGKRVKKTVAFDANTCTFNQNIVITIP